MVYFGHFTLFPVISYQSGIKSIRTPYFGHSAPFPIFSHQSGIKSFRTPNFGHFAPFPITKVVQSDSKWPILVILYFLLFLIVSYQSGIK